MSEDDQGQGPYSCIKCLSSTWNDSDICDACEEEALREAYGVGSKAEPVHPMKCSDTFGELLRQNRERFNMSLSDVAKATELTKAHVWELEQGRANNPTIRTLANLSNALNVPLDDLAYAAARGLK